MLDINVEFWKVNVKLIIFELKLDGGCLDKRMFIFICSIKINFGIG